MSIDKKEIVDGVDIEVAIGKRIKLKKEGHNYSGLCPFHAERSPSFKVSTKKKIYKCFGCGRSGDVIKFVEDFDHVDFQEAIRRLANEFGIVDKTPPEEQKEKIYNIPEPRSVDPDIALLTYMVKDRMISVDTLNKLKVSWSTEYMVEKKEKLSVICFNYFRAGKLVNIKFRDINKVMQLSAKCELIPYNVDAIKNEDEACITEGEIDCATLVECGIDNATSCPNGGTNLDWVKSFYDKKQKIILFTDNDKSGIKFKEKLIKRLGYHRCYEVKYPDGCKDINEVLQKHGSAAVRAVKESATLVPLPVMTIEEGGALSLYAKENPDDSLTFARVLANGTMAYKVNLPGFLFWASRLGFAWIKYSDSENSPVMLVRHVDGILYHSTEQDVIHELLKEADLNYSTDTSERQILYSFIPALPRVLQGLAYFNLPILCDSRDTAHLFFNNGVLKVKKEDHTFVSYQECGGVVWSKYIIDHTYQDSEPDGNFLDFISAISVDVQHSESILSTLGYLLHSYKLRTEAKAVVIVEDVDDESEARGRSGKGLIAQFVELFKNTVQQDGRNYKSDDKFKLQRVDISTQVFYLNDPPAAVLLNQFYNMITDDFIVEMKGQSSYTIPFKKSPKLLVTTNHLPALTSDSDKDRFALLTIKKTFGTTETISSRFPGVLFFDKDHWPKAQFDAAIAVAIDSLRTWLSKGLISYKTPEMAANEAKRLIGATVPEYIGDLMEQVIQVAGSVDSREAFKDALKSIDLDPGKTLLNECFSWFPTEIEINLGQYFRMASIVYKAKLTQKWFGRKFRFWLEWSKYDFTEHKPFRGTRRLVLIFGKNLVEKDQKMVEKDSEKAGSNKTISDDFTSEMPF